MSEPPRTPVEEIAARTGHRFVDAALLEVALTHPSAAYERDRSGGNERFEFLGDAVLDLVVARSLFDAHPDWREGDLTRARATIVNTRSLARRARHLGLGELMRLGRTEQRSGGERKERVLANLFEAIVAAIYLDGGMQPVVALVERVFGGEIASGALLERDPKTRFQEWTHAQLRETPRYRLVRDSGVEDAEDRFAVAVEVAGSCWGEGVGRSKRIAELAAADVALLRTERADERP
ncbi:MAG TPA: ribonuclease III [Myxococcota bacterium]